MKNDIIAESCRICLTKTKKLRSLYKPMDEGDEPPNRMLLLITGIEVERIEEYEMLPKNICKNCELSLSMAFEFRDNALKTHNIIIEYIKELHESSEETKVPESVDKDNYEDFVNIEPAECEDSQEETVQSICNDENSYCMENYAEEELNIVGKGEEDFVENENQSDEENYNEADELLDISKNEHEEADLTNVNQVFFEQEEESAADDQEHVSKIVEGEEDYEDTQQQIEIMTTDEETYTMDQDNVTEIKREPKRKKTSKISTKNNENKVDSTLTQNFKQIPRRGRRPSKNSGQNGHICDICGNVFSKRGRMMEHRQRHNKECNFNCEICDKKFLTRELLRKHMFSHSGGKPLKCEFCSRTFYYESVRKAHEAVHKGLRPYICDICGKDFSYAHALKKHNLIHAEIKLYRCEYCFKDFRLQHHLKQHELTKLHQNAVRFAKGASISFEDSVEVKGEQELEEDMLYIEEIVDDKLVVSTI